MDRLVKTPVGRGAIGLFIVYLALLSTFSYLAYRHLADDALTKMGEQAMTVAVSTAVNLDLDDEVVGRLLTLDFAQLLVDRTNVVFETHCRSLMKLAKIKYIYLVVPLAPEQTRYQVAAGEASYPDHPEGTQLDGIFLLDAVIDASTRLADTAGQGYADKDRYTVFDQRYRGVMESSRPTYLLNQDQWGTYITGFAPWFDREGKLSGVVGVDIVLDDYHVELQHNLLVVLGFCLALLVLGLFSLYLALHSGLSLATVLGRRSLSDKDPLTSLLAHHRLAEKMQQNWARSLALGEPVALFVVDVDGMTQFNRRFGHESGDAALRQVAKALEETFQHFGGTVGRFGGDKFIAMVQGANQAVAESIAGTVLQHVCSLGIPHPDAGDGQVLTVSIGVDSLVPMAEEGLMDVIGRANVALAYAKSLGGGAAERWHSGLQVRSTQSES